MNINNKDIELLKKSILEKNINILLIDDDIK